MKEPTETDFTHSVDREIIRQVGDLNFRGLNLIRQNLIGRDPAVSIVACADRALWSGLTEVALKQVAEAPYLLFDLPFDPIIVFEGGQTDDQCAAHREIWSTAPGRDYVRLLCHFAWQVCRGRAVAATLLLGLAPQMVARLRALPCLSSIRSLIAIAAACACAGTPTPGSGGVASRRPMPRIIGGSGKPPMRVCSAWRRCHARRSPPELVREKPRRRGIFSTACKHLKFAVSSSSTATASSSQRHRSRCRRGRLFCPARAEWRGEEHPDWHLHFAREQVGRPYRRFRPRSR